MRVADFIAEEVSRFTKGHVFMVPGGAAMHLNDAFGRHPDFQCIANLHEQASAISAEGYSRITGELGVAMFTAGPGATNAITGVCGAWLDSTPVLFVSGQVKTSDLRSSISGIRQYGVQEVNIVDMVKGITKYAITVRDPETIKYHVQKAIYLATSGRKGPVWLDIPLDVQGADVDPSAINGFIPPSPIHLDENSLRTADVIELLQHSERPVLLLGNGLRAAKAIDEAISFAEKWNIPILTTWLGMDLVSSSHRLFFGRPGGMAPRGANFTVQNCDLLIAIGARMDLGMVGYSYKNFARKAKKIYIDIDIAELEKYDSPPDLPIHADAREFLVKLLAHEAHPATHRDSWVAKCSHWKDKYPLLLDDHKDPSKPISLYNFSAILTGLLSSEDIIVPGSSGFASEIFLLMFNYKKGQRIYHNRGTGSMGFGLPSSIGACLASGGKRTICVDGDGGFQMNIQELETIRRLNLPIKIFVINNSGYASIRSSQSRYFNQLVCADETSGLSLPPLREVSNAYSLADKKLENTLDIASSISEVLDTAGPCLCEVVVRPTEPREPCLSSFKKSDGTMVSRPIEDLYPFLDREEFLSNMLIEPLKDE